jgi:transposase InsO family protein
MARGMKRDTALKICRIGKRQFYYKSSGKKRGRKKSKYTLQLFDNQTVKRTNKFVKEYIRSVFDDKRVDYGYQRMTGELQLAGFYINHKKVYRLMKEEQLLQVKRPKVAKNYVRYRILSPEGALRLLEMDIKQVWIHGKNRYAYILTIIDVFTRVVLYWTVGYQMRQEQVQKAWEQIIYCYLQPLNLLGWEINIEVRSDNGPQFSATKLRDFLKENYLLQTFTHPYTPQENGHIESFHAILGRDLRGKYFEDLLNLEVELQQFYPHYNFVRIHGSTLKLPPVTFWQQWNLGNIDRNVIDKKKRKVKFALKTPRQHIVKVKHAGNANHREVLSLDFLGSMPEKSK